MARLTWNDVAAPDFGSATQANAQFSQLLGNAFKSAEIGLDDWDKAQSDAVNSAIQVELAKIQDYDKAKMAAAQLLSQVDPRRVSDQTFASIRELPDTLLERSINEGTKEWTDYTRGRTRSDNAKIDAALPAISEIMAARESGDPQKIAAAQAKYGASAFNLPLEQLLEVRSKAQDLERGSVNIAGDRLGNVQTQQNITQSADKHSWEKADRADKMAGEKAIQSTLLTARRTEDARAHLGSLGLSPGAFSYAVGYLSSKYPDLYGGLAADLGNGGEGGGSLGSVGAGSADGWRIGVGGGTIPDNIQTFGQAYDYGQKVLIPRTRGNKQLGLSANKGSSAIGGYQITGQTLQEFAPEALGANWRNEAFTPQNQDKVARAIFDYEKGDPQRLKVRWVSLRKYSDAELRGKSFEQLRPYILAGESGASVAAVAPVGRSTTQAIDGAVNEGFNSNGGNEWFNSLAEDTQTDKDTVADDLLKGRFSGVDGGWVRRKLDEIVAAGTDENGNQKINYRQAGAILNRSLGERGGFFSRLGGMFTGTEGANEQSLGNGRSLDNRKLQDLIWKANSGEFQNSANQAADATVRSQQIKQAESNLNAAQLEYQSYAAWARTQPMSPQIQENLARRAGDVQLAERQFQALMQAGQDEYAPPSNKKTGRTLESLVVTPPKPRQTTITPPASLRKPEPRRVPAPAPAPTNTPRYTGRLAKPVTAWDFLK